MSEGNNFTASTADLRVDVECFAQMINRVGTRHGTDVKENANVGLKNRSQRVKEPVLNAGVHLLLVLLLQAEEDPHRDDSFLLAFDLVRQGDGYCRGRKTAGKTCVGRRTLGNALIYMRRHRLPVHDISQYALMIRAYGRNNTESSRVDLPTTVADDVDDDFLPTALTPRLAEIMFTKNRQCSS